MDLSTTYLGIKLKNPLVAGASPLTYTLDNFKKLEDAGASAVVMYSLFEEQLTSDALELNERTLQGTESFAESLSYFPESDSYNLGPDEYLNLISKAKEATEIPVIASLNGSSRSGWAKYARNLAEAGADAIELNVYMLSTDPELSSAEVESTYLNILSSVKASVEVPVAMKLSPFFSSIPYMAHKLADMDVDGLVLFNRFYQPDINLDDLEVEPKVHLSQSGDGLIALRWIAILYGRIQASLAASTGIHTHEDVLKAIMAGADITQLVAVLLQKGIGEIDQLLLQIESWMDEHEYVSIEQMKGSMSHKSVANPSAFERANYMKAINSYR